MSICRMLPYRNSMRCSLAPVLAVRINRLPANVELIEYPSRRCVEVHEVLSFHEDV